MSADLRARAARLYLVLQGSYEAAWALSVTLMMVFQVQVAGLSALQLVLVGTALEVAVLLGEVPTGVVADLYSRKTSVAVGLVVMGAGFAMGVIWPTFLMLVIGSAVWGVGWTFISGARQAWLVDEVGIERAQPVLTRAHQIGLVAGGVGIVASGLLGLIDVRVPLLIGAAGLALLGVWVAVVLPERGFVPTPAGERSTWQHLRRTLVAGASVMRRSRVVATMAVVMLLSGLASEVFDRLWTPLVLGLGALPQWGVLRGAEVWFSLIALVGMLIGLAASVAANRWGQRWVNAHHPAGLVALLLAVEIIGVVGVALGGRLTWSLWLVLGFLWLNAAAASVAAPIRDTWLNRQLDSSSRATSLSFLGQADAVGQLAGGPLLGSAASRWGIATGLLLASAVKAPAVALLVRLRHAPSEVGGSEVHGREGDAGRASD